MIFTCAFLLLKLVTEYFIKLNQIPLLNYSILLIKHFFFSVTYVVDNTQYSKCKFVYYIQLLFLVLMDESKMSTMQRQKINYSLRSGDPLPSSLGSSRSGKGSLEKYQQKELHRPGTSKRRMFSTIVQSGVYEREKFVPEHPKVDRKKKIERLQDLMYYGKEMKKPPPKEKTKRCVTETAINRFEERKFFIKQYKYIFD